MAAHAMARAGGGVAVVGQMGVDGGGFADLMDGFFCVNGPVTTGLNPAFGAVADPLDPNLASPGEDVASAEDAVSQALQQVAGLVAQAPVEGGVPMIAPPTVPVFVFGPVSVPDDAVPLADRGACVPSTDSQAGRSPDVGPESARPSGGAMRSSVPALLKTGVVSTRCETAPTGNVGTEAWVEPSPSGAGTAEAPLPHAVANRLEPPASGRVPSHLRPEQPHAVVDAASVSLPKADLNQWGAAWPVRVLTPTGRDGNDPVSGLGLNGVTSGAPASNGLGLAAGQELVQVGATVADTQIAETVSYWVTQGVQNAELTLDDLGDAPVAVHIEVDGDLTRVEFRSDQPLARQALEAANVQLRNMLASQGLQLSGVSVGPFDSGGQATDSRQLKAVTRRRIGLGPVDGGTSVSGVTRRHAGGGAVDLYV